MVMHLNQKVNAPLLRNDLNLEYLDRVEIVATPSFGTAFVTADGKQLVYSHTTGTPSQDSLTYRLIDRGGNASETVAITFELSADLRIENTTLNVPLQKPAVAYKLMNAFGDLRFE
jgi:hypothetical protein